MRKKTKAGFTLAELLIVVLVIGILAAIALPQYQKAVERSRMAEAMQRLGDYAAAQQVYYMHHNGFAGDYAALNQGDVQVPEQTEVGNWDTDDSRWKVTSASGSNLEKVEMSAQRMSGIFQGCILTLSVEADGHIEKTCSGNEDCCASAQASGYGEASTSDGSSTGAGTYIIPGHEWDGNQPSCTTQASYTTCTYTYTSGETMETYLYPDRSLQWSCNSQMGVCYDIGRGIQQGETVEYTRFKIDPQTQTTANIYFDSKGNNFGISIQRNDGLNLAYDSEGNLVGGYKQMNNGNDWAYYDSEGNVGFTIVGGKTYDYNANNAPTLSDEELETFATLAQPYIGKSKCQLHPELQGCPSGN